MPFIKEKPKPINKYSALDKAELFNKFMVEIWQYKYSEDWELMLTWVYISSKDISGKFSDWKKTNNL